MGWVLFFDGSCGFCSKSIRRIHKLDKRGQVDFAPLQGDFSKQKKFEKYAERGGGTLVLLREGDGIVFLKSDAVVELGQVLGGAWAFLGKILSLLPRGLRDRGYDLIAKNRYLLSGKKVGCELPDEGLRARIRD
ncbi:thiol-disulfide oxidoreductase DCC family protein [Luteolibacter sp. AS25]|uniref:thiol-disulfide oxidoreductase DCC family protein n=1 Tax=Luteolibacter sp. AS25 TaxID=3135776 RepID=UPI00398B90B3